MKDEILAYHRRTEAFRQTPIGAAFFKFKNRVARAVRMDAEDAFADNDRESTRRAIEEAAAVERELRALLEPISGMKK